MPASRSRRAPTPIARGFAAIAGHQRAITMLRAQRAAGRLAHAYCLIGEEGVGKTAVARALAEELLLGDGQPSRLEVHPDFWSDDRPEAISIDEIRFHQRLDQACTAVDNNVLARLLLQFGDFFHHIS